MALQSCARRDECYGTQSPAIAALMVEIVKKLHASSLLRNIFLNPKRIDQALVYIPGRWELYLLTDSIRIMFDHMAIELGELSPKTSPRLLSLAANVRYCYKTYGDSIIKEARAAMAAHLENVKLWTDTWFGELTQSYMGLEQVPSSLIKASVFVRDCNIGEGTWTLVFNIITNGVLIEFLVEEPYKYPMSEWRKLARAENVSITNGYGSISVVDKCYVFAITTSVMEGNVGLTTKIQTEVLSKQIDTVLNEVHTRCLQFC